MTPILLGILNVTADSFSDGGKYLQTDDALAHGRALMAGGAHGLDIGAAASNPKSQAVPAEVEIARLAPVVAALSRDGVPMSIDTFSPAVQRWALDAGVAYLNDIHGFPDESLYPSLAASDAKLIVMHAVQTEGRATADDVPPDTVYGRILEFFEDRLGALTKAGVARDRLIVDPGMGMFLGRHSESSHEVLRRIGDLKRAFGLPVLISVSRKSFLRGGRPAAEAGPATLAAELFACHAGADYIRTHDPAALASGLKTWNAILTGNTTST
jgi:dihydropteroate synthase type 2